MALESDLQGGWDLMHSKLACYHLPLIITFCYLILISNVKCVIKLIMRRGMFKTISLLFSKIVTHKW